MWQAVLARSHGIGGGACVAQVLTLWRAPDLLPRVSCRHADVSQFLIGTTGMMALNMLRLVSCPSCAFADEDMNCTFEPHSQDEAFAL